MTSVGTLLGSSKIFISHITILNERKKNEIREAGTPATEKQGRHNNDNNADNADNADNNAEDDVPER